MIYRLAAIAAVLALIVGMVLLTAPQPESVARAATGQPLHDPGYSAQQARLVQTGVEDGQPGMAKAPALNHCVMLRLAG